MTAVEYLSIIPHDW